MALGIETRDASVEVEQLGSFIGSLAPLNATAIGKRGACGKQCCLGSDALCDTAAHTAGEVGTASAGVHVGAGTERTVLGGDVGLVIDVAIVGGQKLNGCGHVGQDLLHACLEACAGLVEVAVSVLGLGENGNAQELASGPSAVLAEQVVEEEGAQTVGLAFETVDEHHLHGVVGAEVNFVDFGEHEVGILDAAAAVFPVGYSAGVCGPATGGQLKVFVAEVVADCVVSGHIAVDTARVREQNVCVVEQLVGVVGEVDDRVDILRGLESGLEHIGARCRSNGQRSECCYFRYEFHSSLQI